MFYHLIAAKADGSYLKMQAEMAKTVSDAQHLKLLESENSKLKRFVAEQTLDIVALKDVVSRKW